MKLLPRSLTFSLLVSVLLSGAAPLLRAGSIERTPVSAEELAAVLGVDMKKFEAKFAEPVYATLTLTWRQQGDELVNQLKHSSPAPAQDFSILFSRKDYGKMQQLSGGSNARQLKDLLEMDVKFAGTGFFYRDVNPLAKLGAGHPVQSFVKKQSFEELPLDEAIPLVIEAAAKAPDKLMSVIQSEYVHAPAYIHLSVTFSKKKPEAPKEEEGAVSKTSAPSPAAKPEAKPAVEPKKP